jgi:YggT family protein
MNSAILLIIQVIFGFLATIFTLRFYMQLCNVSTSHDLVQMIIRLTNTICSLFSKVIPRYKNIELSSIIIAIFFEFILIYLTQLIFKVENIETKKIILISILKFFETNIHILMFSTIALAILSWINPVSNLMLFLRQMTDIFLNTIRKVVPSISGIDISPIILLLICQIIIIWPLNDLKGLIIVS